MGTKKNINYVEEENQKIFKFTYWAKGQIGNEEESKTIGKNRDEFIKEFDIVSQSKKTSLIAGYLKKIQDENLDHVEIYKTKKDTYIIISSPYCEDDHQMKNENWKQYLPLYNLTCKTFFLEVTPLEIKTLLKKTNKDHWLKHASGLDDKYIRCGICGKKYYFSSKFNHTKSQIHQYALAFGPCKEIRDYDFSNDKKTLNVD